MTDHAELRRLAKAATPGPWEYQAPLKILAADRTSIVLIALSHASYREDEANSRLIASANPKTILALLDEIDRLRSRLEIDERTPHDGIACRDETIKVLDEKCDRLKAENEVLRGALQAVVDDPTWRSNDNTLWPKIIKALGKGATQ
ncbi:TPA: ead/Ea22-like family protein [Pseudomonas aeruginosa]|uniref:ead/Ea22-like family protein n=1 Tax=Pseudomonas aeruginosa TaxID=287 RepID=UPI00106924EB|nr:ead/Ea22-like family protein [Pseudomonas aeruginosa]HCU0339900.1 ead/Ea22-like family protein [Pseudomonas aeruginosa]